MSFDLQNTDTNNLGMGGLSQFLSQAQNAELDTARQINAGKMPTLAGGGTDFIPAEATSYMFSGGTSGYHLMQSVRQDTNNEGVMPAWKVAEEQKKKGKHVYESIAKGREVNNKNDLTSFMRPASSMWNDNDRLFGNIRTMEEKFAFIKKTGYIVQPKDVFALGLLLPAVKTNLDNAVVNLKAPKAQQIVSGASAGDVQNSQQVFDNSSGDTQRQVATALDTHKDDGQTSFKPAAAKPSSTRVSDGPGRGEWLH